MRRQFEELVSTIQTTVGRCKTASVRQRGDAHCRHYTAVLRDVSAIGRIEQNGEGNNARDNEGKPRRQAVIIQQEQWGGPGRGRCL